MGQGRILVFSAKGGKLNLVCEKEVKGSAYNVQAFQVSFMRSALSQPYVCFQKSGCWRAVNTSMYPRLRAGN